METATATDPSTGVHSTSTAPAATEEVPGSATDPSMPTTTSSATSPVDPTEDIDTGATHTSGDTTTTTTTTATSTTSTSDDSTTTTTGAGTSTSSTGDDSTTGDTTTTSGTTEPGTTTTTTTDSTTGDSSSSTTTGVVEMCMDGQEIECYEGPPGTADVGICQSGYRVCTFDNVFSDKCYTQQLPAAEQCNGLDEDCDGAAEQMYGPKVKVGTGKFPRLVARGDHFVAAWVDPFNKIILQRLTTTGAPIGAAVPLIINGAIHDLDLASYAGGLALGWVRTDVVYDGPVSFVRTFDDELAPLSAEQRLGTAIVTGVDETNLELEGVGGGSSSYLALEVKQEGFNTVVRYAFLPQNGEHATMTVLETNVGGGSPELTWPILAPTDYGVVGIYHGTFQGGRMRGWGPAGNVLWSVQLPAGRAAHVAYTGDDLTAIVGVSNWIGARYSASDGTELAVLPKVSGLYAGQAAVQLSGVYANGNHHVYGCMTTSFTHSRFTKPGAFVPYEAAQAAFGACTPNQAEVAAAAVNGSIGVLQVSGLDLFFHPQLCP
ncbi:putative metal-binding motif-containing protein [Nannocystis pusilla]|uniref:Metal-binding motif-containing protein n=1 Tax=Nannocystis pusilla TaxID=889268 RepID=A0ABS7U3K6_9BACT|nr:putative metal-binding motif-containing protein [Nannocystis pusilla]MBZ5715140.1 putative metal-binding motif-containing protein [Nannocystis pusilla]